MEFPQDPTIASSVSFSLRLYMKKFFLHLYMCCFIVVSSSCLADSVPSNILAKARELRAYLEWIKMGSS